PAYFPNLSPFEHLWDDLGRRVMTRGPENIHRFREMLVEEWKARIRRLIDSMQRRCASE
ncbi:hypothetical protein CAPTEDRAFT_141965, partial [Capitella teleta]